LWSSFSAGFSEKEEWMARPTTRVSRVLMTGPLGPFADAYRAELGERGYAPLSMVSELRQVARFSPATAAESKPIMRTSIHELGIPEDRVVDVVDRTLKLSNELLKSFESSERTAIEAVGQFVITLEEALPAELAGTTDVAKKITKSGLETVDQLVHTEYQLLHHVVGGAATWLSRHDGAPIRA
jgi:hypothetical protein